MIQAVDINNWIGVAAISAFFIGLFIFWLWFQMVGRWESDKYDP
jgi:hypothetical protein